MSTRPSDFDLIERVKNGQPDAFRAIVERHESTVASVVVGMLGPGDEADDVGQETFVRLYRSLEKFRGDASLNTYLTRIAMNLSLNALKRRKVRSTRTTSLSQTPDRDLPADSGASPQRALEQADAQRAVNAAIAELDERQRSVVVLRMLQGLSTKEAAAVLELPEGTVMSRLSRAMKTLETQLRPWMDGHD